MPLNKETKPNQTLLKALGTILVSSSTNSNRKQDTYQEN